jgi:integrase
LPAAVLAPEEEGLVRQARRLRVSTLIGLRWLAVGRQTLAILVAYFAIGLEFPIVAINHHAKEGLHRGGVRVALPARGKARQRWLTRNEVARLLWTCWRAREVQEGLQTDKRPLRHLCRFLLLALYTGSRPGAVLRAAWQRAPDCR